MRRSTRLYAAIAAAIASGSLLAYGVSVGAVDPTDRMRGAPILEERTPPPLQNPDNSDIRRQRAFAAQPPVIPHKVEGYQVDKNVNRCMFCHARTRTQESGAPMVSLTHYQDREGNYLGEISPRRYFCMQCHVPQVEMKPLVNNRFVDVDTLMNAPPGAASGPSGAGKPSSGAALPPGGSAGRPQPQRQ